MVKRLITRLLTVFLLTVCSLGFVGIQTFADEGTTNVEFSVKSKTPENQIDKNITFFYIHSTPNSEQRLEVEVKNLTPNPMKVKGSTHLALSNDNGYITYDGSVTGREHGSMPYKITDYVDVEKSVIELSGNETVSFFINVQMPPQEFSGVLLGGIHFEKVEDDVKPVAGINHAYSYNIGLVIAGDAQKELQHSKKLELIDVKSKVVNGEKMNVINFANPEPAIMKKLDLSVSIIEQSSLKTVVQSHMDALEIAPNSTMEHHVNWNKRDVVPGKYIAKIVANSFEETWTWEYEFEILPEVANDMNENATNRLEMPRWLTSVIVLFGLLTVSTVTYLLFRMTRRKRRKI